MYKAKAFTKLASVKLDGRLAHFASVQERSAVRKATCDKAKPPPTTEKGLRIARQTVGAILQSPQFPDSMKHAQCEQPRGISIVHDVWKRTPFERAQRGRRNALGGHSGVPLQCREEYRRRGSINIASPHGNAGKDFRAKRVCFDPVRGRQANQPRGE